MISLVWKFIVYFLQGCCFHCIYSISARLLVSFFHKLYAEQESTTDLTRISPYLTLFFLISCVSFLLLSKSLALKSILSWVNEMILFTALFWRELACLFVQLSSSSHCSTGGQSRISSAMSFRKKILSKVENVEDVADFSLLDLPELTLECILEKLPPSGLCSMAGVCRSLRERCRSDHLWERHMKKKWGRVVGHAAYREWESSVEWRKECEASEGGQAKGWIASLSCVWPVSWLKLKMDSSSSKQQNRLPVGSIMSWFLSLDSGKFWFPAQVYNRENGHVGFMLSCYDAKLSYDCHTDTFHARYPPHDRRTVVIEEGVEWERIRAPPTDTPEHELHISECLNDLRPGDHIEIQWRKTKVFPYGWWYGVVGHLETCDGNEHLCHCHDSDTVMLEFNHYTPGSRWRRKTINRKNHREDGNENDGFYGGIRKLYKEEEIAAWKQLWPTEILE